MRNILWSWPGLFKGQPYAAIMFPNIHPTTRDLTWQYDFCGRGPPTFSSACGYLPAPSWDKCGGSFAANPAAGGYCNPSYAVTAAKDGSAECPFILIQPDTPSSYVKDVNVTADTLSAQGRLYISTSYTETASYLAYSTADFSANVDLDFGRILFCTNSHLVLAAYLYRYYATMQGGAKGLSPAMAAMFLDTYVMDASRSATRGCEKPPRIDGVRFMMHPSITPTPPPPSASPTPTSSPSGSTSRSPLPPPPPPPPRPPPRDDSGSCFAASATVELEGGGRAAITALRTGDRVRVARQDGSTGFDNVLYVLHGSSSAPTPALRLRTGLGQELVLLGGHFLPASRAGCSAGDYAASRYTPASHLRVGDGLWALLPPHAADAPGSQQEKHKQQQLLQCTPLVHIEEAVAQGVRSPLLQGGSILVEGVAASTHSLWVGEEGLLPPALLPCLPALHNALVSPIQLLGVSLLWALPAPYGRRAALGLAGAFQGLEAWLEAGLGAASQPFEWPWLLVAGLCLGAWMLLAAAVARGLAALAVGVAGKWLGKA